MLRPVMIEAQPYNAETPPSVLRDYPITPNAAFYVRNHFAAPRLKRAEWRLRVEGAVARPRTFTLPQIMAMRPKTLTVTLECAGNGRTRMQPTPPGAPWRDGALGTATWTGVPLREVLSRARPDKGASEVLSRGADQGIEAGQRLAFERSLPLPDALTDDTLLAYRMNGKPLPEMHGSPLRLIVPGWYGVAAVKWLTHISVLTTPFRGWYVAARYIYADARQRSLGPLTRMPVKSLITAPTEGESVRCGRTYTVRGLAWSGHGPIKRVEVRTRTSRWRPARFGRRKLGAYAWRPWSISWTPRKAGRYALMARATDTEGNTQPLAPVWNFYGYAYNQVAPVTVKAR